MIFEWDEAKRVLNLAKHGIDFADVRQMFDGRPVITAPPSAREDEDRFATTGMIDDLFYTVVWTWRFGVIRLISARRARDEEERRHGALHGRAD